MIHSILLQSLKKVFLPGFLAVLFVSLWSCQPISNKNSQLSDWIPQNSSWVIQINDINTLTSELANNEVFREIKSLNPSLTSEFSRLVRDTPDVKSLLCVTTVGKNPSALIHIYKAPIDSTRTKGSSIEYSKLKINIEKSEKNILYSANIEGFTLRSTSQLLIENCIRKFQQKTKPNLENLFDKIYVTLDTSAPLNFLVQPKNEELIEKAIGSIPLAPKINHDWNAYDLNFENSGFSLDGLIAVQDSLGDPMGILKENDAQKILLDQLTPENSTSFLSIPLNNALETEDAFKQWVLHHNIALPEINLKALSTIDEIGWIKLGSETVLLFHSQNEERAKKNLLPKLENAKNFREILYYQTNLPDDILLFSKAIGSQVKPNWGAVIENFFVFTASEKAIKTVIGNYKDGSTLSKNIIYNTFKETLVSESSIYWIAQTKHLIEGWVNKKEKKKPWSKLDTNRFPYIAFQGTLENSFMHMHLRIHENELKTVQNTVSNQYLLQLEAPLNSTPQWLKNHRSKGMDVLVQDVNNKLYLFSDKGNLFWKKQLSGNIQGSVVQVDLYKNKRLQMAFRTEDKFFILDRNGKIVKPFSIKIPSKEPIQPLAVFDYDQRRDYRFVLAQGTNLQMFNSKGKKVTGFKFKKTKTPIINSPVHIRINQKDYIAIQEESGKLNLLNRTGKERVKVKGNIAFSGNTVNSYLKTFTTSDLNGNLIQIDVKGNIIKTNLDLEKGHRIVTTTKSLVSQSNNILHIKGIPINLPFGRYTAPKIYYIKNIIYVTTTDLDAQKVYLYYSNGTPVNGFPVYGSSAADLTNADKDKALELVVQSESDGIIIYEIN